MKIENAIYWVRVVMSAYSMNLYCAQNKEEPVAVAQAEAQVSPVLALTQASYGTLGKALISASVCHLYTKDDTTDFLTVLVFLF